MTGYTFMRIETPTGSGSFIEIGHAPCGDLVVTIESRDCTGYKTRAAIELHGQGKGEQEKPNVQRLFAALNEFSGDV
jgi:hypothetical protein